MALFKTIKLQNNAIIALWEIEECVEQLLELAQLSLQEQSLYNAFKAEQRKKEWLAVRALVNQLEGNKVAISYSESGKPKLRNKFISISHTKGIVAVALSSLQDIAVDIECADRNPEKIAHRFIPEDQILAIDLEQRQKHLLTYWCLKEVMFKLADLEGIDFKKNFIIRNFQFANKNTNLPAEIRLHDSKSSVLLNYVFLKHWIVSWGTMK